MAEIKSGKVKKTPPTLVPANRYEFLNLADAEPDLGVPDISGKVLTSNTSGVRSWESNTTYIVSATTPTSPSVRDVWFNSDDGRTYIYYNDGNTTQWVEFGNANIGGSFGIYTSYTPTFIPTFSAGLTIGNGTATGSYCRVNDFVHVWGRVVFGSTTTVSAFGPVVMIIPVNIDATVSGNFPGTVIGQVGIRDTSATTGYAGIVTTAGVSDVPNRVVLQVLDASGTYLSNASITDTAPITWDENDILWWNMYYKAA